MLCFAMAALITGFAQTPAKPDPLNGLDEYVERVRTGWKIPGMAVGIVRNDSLVYARGFGLREVGKPDPVDTRTLFAIGSNSKSFTAAAAAMLVDDGKLKWNDRVIDWLPGFELYDPWVTRDIRLRDVLSHRSGLGRRGDMLWLGTSYSRAEVLRRVRYLVPNAPFRTEMGYQNIMVLAGGEMVGKAAGMSWDEVIRRRIFAPLGMTASGTSVTELARQADVSTPPRPGSRPNPPRKGKLRRSGPRIPSRPCRSPATRGPPPIRCTAILLWRSTATGLTLGISLVLPPSVTGTTTPSGVDGAHRRQAARWSRPFRSTPTARLGGSTFRAWQVSAGNRIGDPSDPAPTEKLTYLK